jgi:hypothetical protein
MKLLNLFAQADKLGAIELDLLKFAQQLFIRLLNDFLFFTPTGSSGPKTLYDIRSDGDAVRY